LSVYWHVMRSIHNYSLYSWIRSRGPRSITKACTVRRACLVRRLKRSCLHLTCDGARLPPSIPPSHPSLPPPLYLCPPVQVEFYSVFTGKQCVRSTLSTESKILRLDETASSKNKLCHCHLRCSLISITNITQRL